MRRLRSVGREHLGGYFPEQLKGPAPALSVSQVMVCRGFRVKVAESVTALPLLNRPERPLTL
jgi:hypothetical protein